MISGLRVLTVSCVAGLAGALAAGCGGSGANTAPSGTIVPVTEADFHITAASTLKAGTYTFRVHNEGSTDHEFIIAPTTTSTLGLRPDGLTVNEEAVEHLEPGSLEPGAPGAVRYLTVQLKPGRYIFFCNMEGHFMGGMHHLVVVT